MDIVKYRYRVFESPKLTPQDWVYAQKMVAGWTDAEIIGDVSASVKEAREHLDLNTTHVDVEVLERVVPPGLAPMRKEDPLTRKEDALGRVRHARKLLTQLDKALVDGDDLDQISCDLSLIMLRLTQDLAVVQALR